MLRGRGRGVITLFPLQSLEGRPDVCNFQNSSWCCLPSFVGWHDARKKERKKKQESALSHWKLHSTLVGQDSHRLYVYKYTSVMTQIRPHQTRPIHTTPNQTKSARANQMFRLPCPSQPEASTPPPTPQNLITNHEGKKRRMPQSVQLVA